MKSLLRSNGSVVFQILFVLLVVVLMQPRNVFAECQEFKIVEYEDRIEAVCVGEPLTETQKKANLEDERRQEAEAQRQRVAEQRREQDAARVKAEADAAAERKNKAAQMPASQKPIDKKLINRQK